MGNDKVQLINDKLWKDFIAGIKDGTVNSCCHINDYGEYVIARMLESRSAKEMAWDKVRQFGEEMGSYTLTDVMDSTLKGIELEQADNKLRRDGKVTP